MQPYKKPALPIPDQIALLKERGMEFPDEAQVAHYLNHIGYYRLSAYWLPFEQPTTQAGPTQHQFQSGTSFEQVLSLYIFDRKLRQLTMEPLERIESAIRTQWAHALAIRHGPHAYLDDKLFFKSPEEHAKEITQIGKSLKQSKEAFIADYQRRYSEPALPPIWVLVETFSFGNLSRWFKETKDIDAKRQLAKSMDMPNIGVLENVLHALSHLRNVCAHHGRLWNRRFTLRLPHIKRLKYEMVVGEKAQLFYNYVLVMAHLMNQINNGTSSWSQRLGLHLQSATQNQQDAMGFPNGWGKCEPFKSGSPSKLPPQQSSGQF